MKIQNTTQWDTKDLRSLILAGMKEFLGTNEWKYRQMLILVSKRKRLGGRSTLGGARIKLFLPNEFDPIQLAWMIAHELNHTVGLNHKDMRGNFWANWHSSEELMASDIMGWALLYLNIEKKEVKIKEKKDIQITRYEKAQKILENKLSKLKRLQNQIKKWSGKVKYYEKTLVLAGKIPNVKEE